jgi:hypothetical protein
MMVETLRERLLRQQSREYRLLYRILTSEALNPDDWSLSSDQMIFMLQHNNEIEAAYERDDLEFLRSLAASDEYKSVFGDMSFDEAYDRYETLLEDSGDLS